MRITKLPDRCDPSLMIQKRMHEKFSLCPFCGETRSHTEYKKEFVEKLGRREHITHEDVFGGYGVELKNLFPGKGWFGPARCDIIGILLPWRWHYWSIDSYKCYTCGAEWDSDPYPTDITGL